MICTIRREVLDCASALALSDGHRVSESGRGLPQSMTLARVARWLGLFAIGLACLTADAEETNNVQALQKRLGEHLAQPRFAAATWGVKVVSLDSGKLLFDHNGGKLLKPASNAKLYTAALALDRLGPEFRIKTSLYSMSRPDKSGILWNDLIVYGRGDPSFSARFRRGDYAGILQPVADAIVAAGVKQIRGDLIGDESFFQGPPFGTQWTWDDLQQYYGAEASALTVQDNVVDLVFKPGARIGAPCSIITQPVTTFVAFSNRTVTMEPGMRNRISVYRPVGGNVVHVTGWMGLNATNATDAVSVHRPALWFVTLLREELARRGITVKGTTRSVNWLDRQIKPLPTKGLIELGSVTSPALPEILAKMMKPSQNLYAHLLLLQVGARNSTPAYETTEDAGLAEMKRFLESSGVPSDEVLLEEGSGLSRGALVTPDATVMLLQFMHRHRWAQVFRDSLPVAGVDGTLRNRMKGTPAAGNARAKTGTLRYVNTLSGYVTTRAHENIVFSLMLNNYEGDGGRAALDAIVVLLAEWSSRF